MEFKSTLEIDWQSAETDEEGTLSVYLMEKPPRGWDKRFLSVLAMLNNRDKRWGAIKPHRESLEVAAVQEGAEEDLRYLLESVLLQVNADLNLGGDTHLAPPPAQRQTEKFRSFAG